MYLNYYYSLYEDQERVTHTALYACDTADAPPPHTHPRTHTGPSTHTAHLSCVSEMSSVSTMYAVCAACLFYPWQSYPIPWHAFCMDDGELFSWRRWSHPFSYAWALYTHSSQGQRAEGCRRCGIDCVWAFMKKKSPEWTVSNDQLWSAGPCR